MIVHLDDDTASLLEKEKRNILKSVDNIINNINISYQIEANAVAKKRKQNPYIVKSVIKYMATGLSLDNAIIKTATRFETTTFRVKSIFWEQKRYMSAVKLYAKRFTCEKLKKHGMTAKQIANILDISENHVFKILRCNADFWFLK